MAAKKISDEVYAFVRAEHDRSSRYGHVNIHVHELFGWGGPSLKITCQTGGEYRTNQPNVSYAWDCGLSADYSLIKGEALKRGYFLLQKIERNLRKVDEEYGPAPTFAAYATRVLVAIGLKKVHVLGAVNGTLGLGQKIADLPTFEPLADQIELRCAISKLEDSLLELAA